MIVRLVNRSSEAKGIETVSCDGRADAIKLELKRCDQRFFHHQKHPCLPQCATGVRCVSCPPCSPQLHVLAGSSSVDVRWPGYIYEDQQNGDRACPTRGAARCNWEGLPNGGDWVISVFMNDLTGRGTMASRTFALPLPGSPPVLQIDL